MEAPIVKPRRFRSFSYHVLMPHVVKDILLVASDYDRFILEEDGRFSDRLLSQYQELDLSAPPYFDHVTSAREALEHVRERNFDLVLTTPHFADLSPRQLAERLHRHDPELPVVMLTYDRADAQAYAQALLERPWLGMDHVFQWTGDPRLLLALVKSVEDLTNVDHDTDQGLVRVIILVEDSPSFYSAYLPLIYKELLTQIQSLLADRLNERDRHYRMRARPKILLARTYEEGLDLFRRYREYLLGILCDMRFPRHGQQDPHAGRDFIRLVREELPDLPILLQSSEPDHARLAEELGVPFADKNSRELLALLRNFMWTHFGFGPFIFQSPDGRELARAEDLRQMNYAFERVPEDSLRYHAARNHISNWLMARSEFALAMEVRPKRVSDFATTEEMRQYLIDVFTGFLDQRQRGQITDFSRQADLLGRDFIRLGSGSMGGKARGIAFMSHILADHWVHERYPGVQISVPRTVVVCTDVFDRFCARADLRERAIEAESDEEVAHLFLQQPLDDEITSALGAILAEVRYPLAVRSSSLHEDSEFHPLAGLYRTFILPNSSPSEATRQEQLSRAIRLVFASTFFRGARTYMQATSLRLEEEKMAVIIEQLVGRHHGERFYPDFAGVAQSHNYYPMGYLEPEDGIATVALGLGQTVVEGRRAFRFSPRHPDAMLQMASPREALRTSQRRFYALSLADPEVEIEVDEAANLMHLDLEAAEEDGTLEALGATYCPDNDRVYDTIYRSGTRLVNFSGVLKYDRFPLAPILSDLLEIGRRGMGTPVEMEFAVTLGEGGEEPVPPRLAVLQLRPLVAQGGGGEVDLSALEPGRPTLLVGQALGNGVLREIRDVVYVHPERCDFARSREMAREIARINEELAVQRRPYILIGPGRWGTADPWLGIPVSWTQVSAARVIAELEMPGSHIDPSQGTHFFHNITSLRIGYFCINLKEAGHAVALDELEALAAQEEVLGIRHVVLPEPVEAHIDGRSGRGVVLAAAVPEAS